MDPQALQTGALVGVVFGILEVVKTLVQKRADTGKTAFSNEDRAVLAEVSHELREHVHADQLSRMDMLHRLKAQRESIAFLAKDIAEIDTKVDSVVKNMRDMLK